MHLFIARTLCAALAALALVGCGTTSDIDVIADLEIQWSINGSSDPSLCTAFGVDRWSILVDGPELYEVVTDCVAEPWDTGTGLYGILEGAYSVDIAGLDVAGFDVGGARTSAVVRDRGYVSVIDVPLVPADFVP